jgi:tetratricopeptide (TPR) repeat protein
VTKSLKIGLGVAAALFLALGCAIAFATYYVVNALHGRKLFDEGYAAMKRGEHAIAVRHFDEALRRPLVPYFAASAHFDRGFSDEKLGNRDEALRDYSEAIKIKPDMVEAYVYRGNLYEERKEIEEAFHDYSEAIRLDKNAAWPLYQRGLIFLLRKDADKAIADFSEAIRASPNYAAAYINRAIAYRSKNDWDSALASLDAAIGIDPGSAVAHVRRADVYRHKGEMDKAINDFTEALKLDPKNTEALRARALTVRDQLQSAESITDLTEAIRRNPKDEKAFQARGLIYGRQGDDKRAIADFSEWIRIRPSRSAYDHRARAQTRAGNYASAIADYNEGAQHSGPVTVSVKGLAWLLATCPDASFRNEKQAVAEAKEDCERTAWKSWNCLDTLATALAAAGNFDEAVNYEKQALDSNEVIKERRDEMAKRLALFQNRKPYREASGHRQPGEIASDSSL